MIKFFLLLSSLATILAAPNPLQGVWEGHFVAGTVGSGQADCLITAQFLPWDYIAILSGCGDPQANGVSMGIYFLAQDIITITFAGSVGAGGAPGTSIDIDWWIDGQSKLHLRDPNVGWEEIYTKEAANSYDGVWAGNSAVNGTVVASVFAEFLSTTYLSFPMINPPNYGAFIGLATLEGSNMPVYYAISSEPSLIGLTLQTDFVMLNPGFSLDHAPYSASPQEAWKFTATQKQSTSTALQGVWVGYTNGCTTTLDFRANLYRAFQTQCADISGVGLHFGVWASDATTTAMTKLTLYFGYASFQNLAGTNSTYTITFGVNTNTFHLTGPEVDNDYYKVADQTTSATIVVVIVLSGDYTTFAAATPGFIADLSTVTNINSQLIVIRNDSAIDSQTFYTTVQFSDDPTTGAKAVDVPAKLKNQQLGDYTVISTSVPIEPYSSSPKAFSTLNPVLLFISMVIYGAICFI